MAGAVIADAGPLIALGGIDRLDLLHALFAQVCVPQAVWDECRAGSGMDSQRIAAARDRGWLRVCPPPPIPDGRLGNPALGAGECAAMVLALEMPGSLLLMDDRQARRQAHRLGLRFIGTARVLWLAQQRGFLDSAEAAIRAMAESGYRISPTLLQQMP